ncbi:MAG: LysR family transcriptional regulator [Proteobacteria bacterium]|nr:LysR family transcriptional regulator [Pseudomonadota bacterium]
MNMTTLFSYLECFCAVAESSNISAAAENLGITQPSASRQLRLLEEGLGVELFHRGNSGVRLTDVGRTFASQVIPLMKQIGETIDVTQERSDQVEGHLRFGCLTEIGQSHFLERVLRFKKKFPSVNLSVEFMKDYEIVDRLVQGTLDLGVTATIALPDPLVSSQVVSERAVLVCRRGFQIKIDSKEDLDRVEFVAYREDDPLLHAWIKKNFGAFAIKRAQIALSVNSHRSMIDAILDLDMVAVMPYHSVSSHVANGLLRVASHYEIAGYLFIAQRQGDKVRRAVKLFREFLL